MDGHTYYFLLDEYNTLHICSNGKTRCGVSALDMVQIDDEKLKTFELCSTCQVPAKKAQFASQATFVDGEGNEL